MNEKQVAKILEDKLKKLGFIVQKRRKIMDGIERLRAEVLEMNNYNVSAIFEYLKTKKELYEKFNNEEKSIKQMYKYICDKARKMAKNNVAMVNDKVVYLWAMTYFNKTNRELGIEKEEKKVTKLIQANKPTETKKEIKKIEEIKKESAQISMFQEVEK